MIANKYLNISIWLRTGEPFASLRPGKSYRENSKITKSASRCGVNAQVKIMYGEHDDWQVIMSDDCRTD
ncbi:MAG: hypothetical protein KDK27_17335, partial [Leptospiraceae bacterium]|nr:hypothetical protein [Leptospiraceae bacterium]